MCRFSPSVAVIAAIFLSMMLTPALAGNFSHDFSFGNHTPPNYELPPVNGAIASSLWSAVGKQTTVPSLQPPLTETLPTYLPGKVMRVRVLVVIYTNTAAGTTTQSEIDKLKSEIEQARLFYFRNSHCRCFLDVTYMIIDDFKEIDEFWNLGGAYWMTFWDTDGDGRSVVKDLQNRGVTNNMYSGVVNFYAWGENGYPAAFGGGAYGVDVGFLGQTAYCAIPHCWDPDTNDWFFIHEFHHELDSMFHYSGFPEYAHADLPIELPGDFGEGYDFNAFIMRTWPVEKWMALKSPWGSYYTVTDADSDGLPDSGPNLPITEASIGSSPSLVDTDGDGLTDLGEAMGGIFRVSIPTDTDTDNDGIDDGSDKYPIYAIDEYVPRGTRTINGTLESDWHVLGSPMDYSRVRFSAAVKTNWDPNYLYLGFSVNNYCRLRVCLDADNDGWFHGKDNYEIVINPENNSVSKAHILDCSPESVQTYGGGIWDDDPRYTEGRLVTEQQILKGCKPQGSGYIIEIGIPKNTVTKLVPQHADKIGIRLYYSDINHAGADYATAFEQDVFIDLILVDAASWQREDLIGDVKNHADGQMIDLIGKTVSAVFAGCFYIQDENRASGIKVESDESVVVGDKVRVMGRLATVTGERVLQNAIVEKLPVSSPP